MLILQALILGIVQGLTEFMPVSSAAHLILVPWLLGWNDPALTSLPFDVALHLGTLIAVLIYFAGDWRRLIRAGIASITERKIGDDPDRRLAWLILAACIPGGIAGVWFEGQINDWFHTPGVSIQPEAMLVMAVIIMVLGGLLLLAEKRGRQARPLPQLTLEDAWFIGLAQAFAVFPGVSRSGSTITAGLGLGLNRDAAARFSFLLSAPIIAGAGAKSLLEIYGSLKSGVLSPNELTLFPIGVLAAAMSGYLTIRFLMQFLQSHSVAVFAYYRWLLAAIILVFALMRR